MDVVLNPLAFDGLAIDVQMATNHLDAVAGQADDAEGVDRARIPRQPECENVAPSRRGVPLEDDEILTLRERWRHRRRGRGERADHQRQYDHNREKEDGHGGLPAGNVARADAMAPSGSAPVAGQASPAGR